MFPEKLSVCRYRKWYEPFPYSKSKPRYWGAKKFSPKIGKVTFLPKHIGGIFQFGANKKILWAWIFFFLYLVNIIPVRSPQNIFWINFANIFNRIFLGLYEELENGSRGHLFLLYNASECPKNACLGGGVSMVPHCTTTLSLLRRSETNSLTPFLPNEF